MAHLQVSQVIPAPRFEVFDFLNDPSHLPALLKPAIDVEVFSPDVPLKRGSEFHFIMTRLGLSQSVRLRVEDVLRGSRLTYRQAEGLFAEWTHTIKFEDRDERSTLVTDLVDYRMPFGIFGTLADDLLLKRDLRKILENRLSLARDHFLATSK